MSTPQSPGVQAYPLVESLDAGSYYCAHLNYMMRLYAMGDESAVLRTWQGDWLQCFLHVPGGDFDMSKPISDDNVNLKRLHLAVEGIVRSYWNRLMEDGPFRLLVTGYDAFMEVKFNPCAAYVRLLESGVFGFDMDKLNVRGVVLPVSDRALDLNAGPLSEALEWQPHAIISLGVCRARGKIQVEVHADDSGLDIVSHRHMEHKNPTQSLLRNFSGLG